MGFKKYLGTKLLRVYIVVVKIIVLKILSHETTFIGESIFIVNSTVAFVLSN